LRMRAARADRNPCRIRHGRVAVLLVACCTAKQDAPPAVRRSRGGPGSRRCSDARPRNAGPLARPPERWLDFAPMLTVPQGRLHCPSHQLRHVREPDPVFFPEAKQVPEAKSHLELRTFLYQLLRFALSSQTAKSSCELLSFATISLPWLQIGQVPITA
jgi:hypothetical protein